MQYMIQVHKIENGNGKGVKGTKNGPKSKKNNRRPIGLEHSKTVPHPEENFSWTINKKCVLVQ